MNVIKMREATEQERESIKKYIDNISLTVAEPTITKSEAAQIVFYELLQCDLFNGKYDAKNGDEHFMYGICTVMENIAYMISEECHDRFDTEFMRNMQISEDKYTNEEEN